MQHHQFLGPRLFRSRAFVGPLHALVQLSIGPILIVIGIVTAMSRQEPDPAVFGTVGGLIILAAAITWLLWSGSAYLDVHRYGIVVGRSLGGAPREMWYSEIHPASIRVWSDIDSIRSLPHRMISPHWHMSGGADLAVTFIGPARDTHLQPPSHPPRPPVPGRGLVLFGSQDAPRIADEIRAGLQRAGCPPQMAHRTARFGVQETKGMGFSARGEIPGMHADWRP